MGRAKGTVKYGLNLEVQTPAPLDARSLVPTKADLILAETWIVAPSTQAYTYTGMLVVVASDPTTTNNGIYMLKSRTGWADPEQWSKLSSETVFSITGLNITGLYNETADHVYMKADVVSVNGSLYYCLVDNTTNIKPTVTTDWQNNWALFQLKGSEGAAGATPTIGNNGNWYINGVDQLVKALGVNGITPHIEDGYWYIGNDKQGKATGTQITITPDGYWMLDGVKSNTLALGLQGEAAIANINYLGDWDTNILYKKSDRNGKTDVVVGSDKTMYAALADSRGVNPVTDTLHNTWVVFSMRGIAGKQGDTPYIKEGYWWIGEERKDVKAAGDVLSISTDGYWEINGVATTSKAVATDGKNGTNGTHGQDGENAVANINVRGPWETGQTYIHLNVDGTTDVVLAGDGTSYFCLQDTSIDPLLDTNKEYWAKFSLSGSPGLTPHIELDEDGEYRWYIGTVNQNIIAEGRDGKNGKDGKTASQPYITEQGYWGYKLLLADGTYKYSTTTTLAIGMTPHIEKGYWYIGNQPTGVQAIGQSAIANLNYVGDWKTATQYYHSNPNEKGWTDVVLGADDNSYYAKLNSINVNPCKQVDDVWVRDEAQSQYWAKFVMKGTAVDGRNIELRNDGNYIQWRVVGSETWTNLIEKHELAIPELSDISTPIGSVIMYAGAVASIPKGYLLADGRTVQKTEYWELVEKLTGGNTAQSAVLPDLRSRFIVGYDPNDIDYDVVGETGGFKKVRLSADESGLPKHKHTIPFVQDAGAGYRRGVPDGDKDIKNAKSEIIAETGGGAEWAAKEAHENRPPYYVLAYLVKATYYGEIKTPYDTLLQTIPEGQTPPSKVQWLESLRGETGATGINPKGYYNDTIEYVEDDTIIINNVANPLNGNSYVCKVSAVTGVEPGITVGWEGSWYPFVMRGAPGPAAPQVLVRYSENSSTAEGSDWHATPTISDVYARFSTDGAVTFGSPIQFKGSKGDDAFPIKIQYSITGAGDWSDTATATSKYLRFSTDNGVVWSNVITIQGGSSVFTADIQANLPSNRFIGKYNYNSLIPAAGKTFEEVLRDIVTDNIAPTASVSASGSIPYNDAGAVDRNITVTMNASSNNSGGSITERKLYYKRVGDSTWIELKNQPGNSDITANQTTYIHNVKDLLISNNEKGFEYRLTVKDSLNATKEANSNAITPSVYSAPTYSIGAFSDTKEKGDVAKAFIGSISQTAQNGVQVLSYELQYKLDGGSWTQFKIVSYAIAPTMPIVLSGVDNSTIINTIKNASSVQYQMIITATTKNVGVNSTTTINIGTTTLGYNRYSGAVATLPSGADSTARRAAVIGYNPTGQAISAGTFVMATGSTHKDFFVCLPPGLQLVSALDTTANATVSFTSGQDYIMKDAGGNDRTHKMYTVTLGQAFSSSHNWTITIGVV